MAGLFDSSVDTEYIGKEIVKCINMARDGIHAVLVVLTVWNRFSKEAEAAISSLRTLFGSKINDYMIVVFTGGDELEENEQTLEEFLEDCPDSLKVESRLKETTIRLEQQLAEEQIARLKAEEMAHAAQLKSNDEIRKLRETLERAQRETEELRKRAESGKCNILLGLDRDLELN
ncbi:hypothetical protein L1987_07042 [Smallanthus sonchifolius]|uniref:Uncharacterized protein n=1 Tax=Smallanthus sonchifolius TaxID=185202 RepID=A0ACB9JZX8_9ASTR|nr:hypothetical protein L1987_07042 [Smallanthus sonchifolius]